MNQPAHLARWTVRVTGAIQIILGLIIWTGNAGALVPIHILDGLVFVVALLGLAVLGARAGEARGLVALTIAWVVLLPVLGITQAQILPGGDHVVIQVLHLLVGLIAIGLGERLGRDLALREATAATGQ